MIKLLVYLQPHFLIFNKDSNYGFHLNYIRTDFAHCMQLTS